MREVHDCESNKETEEKVEKEKIIITFRKFVTAMLHIQVRDVSCYQQIPIIIRKELPQTDDGEASKGIFLYARLHHILSSFLILLCLTIDISSLFFFPHFNPVSMDLSTLKSLE